MAANKRMNSTKKLNVKKDSNEHSLKFGENTKFTKKQKQIAWRRQKIFSLLVKGTTNTYDLADACNTSQSTVVRDISSLRY